MTEAMTATDYEEYEEAVNILKVFIAVKADKKKVPNTVTKLRGFKDNTKKKGWEVLNKYKIDNKEFADKLLENYEQFEEGEQITEELAEIAFGDFLSSVTSTEKDELEREIDNNNEFNEEQRTIIKNEFVPIILLSNNLKNKPEQEKQELGIILTEHSEYLFIKNEKNLKNVDKRRELEAQLVVLKSYTESSGDKHAVFNGLGPEEKKEIEKLVNKMQARVSEMIKSQTIEPAQLPSVSIPVIFGIVGLVMALGGVIFYFLKDVYGKEPEEIQ